MITSIIRVQSTNEENIRERKVGEKGKTEGGKERRDILEHDSRTVRAVI